MSGDALPPLRNNEKNKNTVDKKIIVYDQRAEKDFLIDINRKCYYILDGYNNNYLSMYGKQIKDLKDMITFSS